MTQTSSNNFEARIHVPTAKPDNPPPFGKLTCPNCTSAIQPGWNLCPNCGNALNEGEAYSF